jgi:PKD repeat protein
MGFTRGRGAVVVAVLAAVVLGCAPGAQASSGLAGAITDAYTGLALPGATLAWNAGQPVAADASGHYVLVGLDNGAAGTLNVTGPAGYETQALPVTLPATGGATQNVTLHRDWAASAGGATIASNDDSGTAANCGSAQAVDGDRTTGWSATTAAHTADDPAQITIALPQTIDVRQLVLDPTAACGHDAGAALGAYKILTSQDGNTYNLAASGTLDATSRGANQAIVPTANASQVRFIRLQALAPQDAASPTVDLRELQVFGPGPDTAPAGTVAATANKNYIKQAVTLRAAFTASTSTITRYLWDFDGDGRWDQATFGATVSHIWMGAGTYHVIVGVRDLRGSLGTAALDLRIIDPDALVQPILQRRPLITFDPVDGIDLPVRIACASQCTFTASLVISKTTARQIHAPRRTILKLRKHTEGPGLGSWDIELPSKTIRLLRKAHKKSVRAYLTASAVDQQRRRSTTHRWVTFR